MNTRDHRIVASYTGRLTSVRTGLSRSFDSEASSHSLPTQSLPILVKGFVDCRIVFKSALLAEEQSPTLKYRIIPILHSHLGSDETERR